MRSSSDATLSHPMCWIRTLTSLPPENQFARSYELGKVPAPNRNINVSQREKQTTLLSHIISNVHGRHKLPYLQHATGFSATPFPHTIHMGADVAASSCNLDSMVWPLPWDGDAGAISRFTSAFCLPTKQHSAGQTSCHTRRFEQVNRAI